MTTDDDIRNQEFHDISRHLRVVIIGSGFRNDLTRKNRLSFLISKLNTLGPTRFNSHKGARHEFL